MSQHSKACCTIPPVVSKDYTPKGKYITVDGLKTYVTGPANAKRALLCVYDIFGFFPQTIQGADILAHSDSERPYLVVMPDWFEGSPAPISWYPPDTEEKGKNLGAFFQGPAAPPKTVARVPKVLAELKASGPTAGIDSWGMYGYCWGGKIVSLCSEAGTPFKAAAACHPAMVDPTDAPRIAIPFAMLPSQDEDKNDVSKWQEGLKVKGEVTWFNDQIHGFMAARGDLEQESVKRDYEKAYKTLLNFFHQHLYRGSSNL